MSKRTDLDVARELIAGARERDAVMTAAPWEIWTSNSFHRITSRDQQDGGVLSGAVHPRDGHPDLYGRNRDVDLEGIAWIRNNLPALIAGYERTLDECERLTSARDLACAAVSTEVETLRHRAAGSNDLREAGLRLADELVRFHTALAALRDKIIDHGDAGFYDDDIAAILGRVRTETTETKP